MKDFLKFTLATIVGIIVSCVLLVFLSIVALFGIAFSSDTETRVPDNSVMALKLKGALEERSQETPFGFLIGEDYANFGLDDVLASIKKAKENEKIKGIYLQADNMSAGFASLQAIRDALEDFKASGKFIVAYGDTYGQGAYYLASVADKVLLNPKGTIAWRGLASVPIFYKNLLDKIGVEMQVFKVGTYKSAVEPFIATEMSPANREQINAYIGSIWGDILTDVAASRNLTAGKLNELAGRMLMLEPGGESVECGLADTLIYQNDVRDYLKGLAGIDKEDDLQMLSLNDMINVKRNVPKDKSGNIVAVYYATGEIVEKSSSSPMISGEEPVISSEKMISDLLQLKENDDVKAVVLRVNSPGGSAYASEQIWHAVSQLKEEKPVIVSMGDYAASGGYYISCNADTIVAEPATLTGSIGIFGLIPNMQGLTKKLGLDFDVVKTNAYSDFGSIFRPMNEDEKSFIQRYINEGYELFLSRCSDGRGIDKTSLDSMAQGRVWTGSMAKELGLVDELGGLDKALEIAIDKAGIENDGYTVLSYPKEKSFIETLANTVSASFLRSRILSGTAAELYKPFSMLENIDKCDRIQARLPFRLTVQ